MDRPTQALGTSGSLYERLSVIDELCLIPLRDVAVFPADETGVVLDCVRGAAPIYGASRG